MTKIRLKCRFMYNVYMTRREVCHIELSGMKSIFITDSSNRHKRRTVAAVDQIPYITGNVVFFVVMKDSIAPCKVFNIMSLPKVVR